jgi:hypothetical protein
MCSRQLSAALKQLLLPGYVFCDRQVLGGVAGPGVYAALVGFTGTLA